jgi:hypothetical protein
VAGVHQHRHEVAVAGVDVGAPQLARANLLFRWVEGGWTGLGSVSDVFPGIKLTSVAAPSDRRLG